MSKLVIADISADYGATASINTAFDDIETAFENTLSRDGTAPNAMSAEIDMGTNDLNNVKTITAQTVVANGQSLVPSSVVAIDTASSVPNVPAGNIAATDVQTAINELDTEKVALAGAETIAGDKTLSGTTIISGDATLSGTNVLSGPTTISGALAITNDVTLSKDLIQKQGTTVPSIAALVLGDGNIFSISGTNAITSIGTKGIGTIIVLEFEDILVLTNHVTNLILPTGANITTAAGDVIVLREYAIGDYSFVSYTKADGTALIDASVSLGAWTSKTFATDYQAVTDGFVTAYAEGVCTVIGLTDGNTTPTTIRSRDNHTATLGGASVFFPVKKDDYYRVTEIHNSGTPAMFFIPLS